jgi:Zn-dependent protease with chaperone function
VITEVLSQLWVQMLGWTLLHFLWQGTVMAILYAAARAALGRSISAQGRYTLASLTLGILTAAPAATFLLLPALRESGGRNDWWVLSAAEWQTVLGGSVAAWLLGVVLLSLRLASGCWFTVRLRKASHPAPQEWELVIQRTAARVRVSTPVRLLVSSLAEVPMVVGWLRPVILVPVTSLTGLPIEQMTALLAHELAHIRRRDYLVNLLQRMAETLLFYHPAVWWVSRQIRLERELCCDDIAVAASGDAVTYARALAGLESQRSPRMTAAVAANGGFLVNRVRRLFDPSQTVTSVLPGPGSSGAMSLLWIGGISLAMVHCTQAPDNRLALFEDTPAAILYDPFLPAPEALRSRYGTPHTALPNGPELMRSRPVPNTLRAKYAKVRDALRPGPLMLRRDALDAPLPEYAEAALRARKQGLVVIEVVVSPAGRVQESQILATFDEQASAAVTTALNTWRFHTVGQLDEAFGILKNCEKCVRIGRLGFEFRIDDGKGVVVDLAGSEAKRRVFRNPSPFVKRGA